MRLGGATSFAPTGLPPTLPATHAGQAPRVSVALCVYNGERWLREQLDSLLAQEGVHLEVVVVDDRSTDGSLALLQDYAARDPRVRVFENDTNLGHLRSFEKCMTLCTHPLIAPCDQDDVWHPHKLARLASAIEGADLAYCDSAYMDDDGKPMGRCISDDLQVMHAGRDPMKYVFQNTVSGHALLVRREVFDAARPFPDLLYHDWWLAMRAAAGAGVVYVDEPLVRFRRHCDAYSPLGKKAAARRKSRRERKAARAAAAAASSVSGDATPAAPHTMDRKWVAERLYLLHAFGATGWRGSETCRALEQALLDAMAGKPAHLFRAAWAARRSVPPFRGSSWINALRFYNRCRRKLHRAREQPEVTSGLFRA